ncbi:hypothetical protein LCGC14_2572380 [marine sediment metagenome]|uniref:Topo IIA-type catalytic domain-containing protein n=1 Tax=marine sediment metagenome TaxID=412755 RepID=A0A0F9B4T8_9ZZZZ
MAEVKETINERFEDKPILEELKNSYLNYAMSVIVARALPDVRDGLKPSQRRILVAMNDLNLGPRGKHRKCAKIVGDTGGNYHPHGDQATYGRWFGWDKNGTCGIRLSIRRVTLAVSMPTPLPRCDIPKRGSLILQLKCWLT